MSAAAVTPDRSVPTWTGSSLTSPIGSPDHIVTSPSASTGGLSDAPSEEVHAVPSGVKYGFAGPDPSSSRFYSGGHGYAPAPPAPMSIELMTPEQRQFYVYHYYHASGGLFPPGYVPPAGIVTTTGGPPPPPPEAAVAAGGLPIPAVIPTVISHPSSPVPPGSGAATPVGSTGYSTPTGVAAPSSMDDAKFSPDMPPSDISKFKAKDTKSYKRGAVRAAIGRAGGEIVRAGDGADPSIPGGASSKPIVSHMKLITEKVTEKSRETKRFLLRALKREVLFQEIDDATLKEIADVMYVVNCKKGDNIITQGEYGDAWFVVEFGTLLVIIQEAASTTPKIVGESKAGDSFGEGSLLFSVPRSATMQAKDEARVWALDAKKFSELRASMSKAMAEKSGKRVKFLMRIPFFSNIFSKDEDYEEIASALYSKIYNKGDKIIKQGDPAAEFFIMRHGTVDVEIKDIVTGEVRVVRTLKTMDAFGERGLISGNTRSATITATSARVKCYVMNKADFINLLLMPLNEEFQKEMKVQDLINLGKQAHTQFISLVRCKLEDFIYIGVLGVGSFGRVSLVQDPTTKETYSLKKIRKNKVIETNQEEHVRNERAVLANLDSDFCCRLYATYQDKLNIYFLLEPVLGGELFTVLRWNQKFSEKTARFYAACTILALEHLHNKNLIYRDLKPENLLISANGYCKLVDFGFAKRRNKSCTLCGTPEYLAPEVIQGYPQGFGVDWWELGIFIFEMVVGNAPFQDDPHMKMYEKILRIPVEFPSKRRFSERIKDLIRRLLMKEAHSRLGSGRGGAEQIKSHAWFDSLDWTAMMRQEMKPPYKPKIESETDVSCFEEYDEEEIDEDLLADPEGTIYKWCEDF